MKSIPLISVIIPIYNVEEYIERCAKSLLEQTIQDNIEYIFVNDCTPDNSIEILKNTLSKYPTQESHVKIINHISNKGLPQARKTGIEAAKGKYIIHVDSDDWIESDMIEVLINKIRDGDLDVLVYDYYESNGISKKKISKKFNRKTIIRDVLKEKTNPCVWNKIVKKELYNDIFFPKYNMGEDLLIIIQLLLKTNKIDVIHIPLYNYFINNKSISKEQSKESCLNRFNNLKQNTDILIGILKEKSPCKYLREILIRKYKAKSHLIQFIDDDDVYKLWQSSYTEINKWFIIPALVPIKYVIISFLIKIRVYSKIKKIFNVYL